MNRRAYLHFKRRYYACLTYVLLKLLDFLSMHRVSAKATLGEEEDVGKEYTEEIAIDTNTTPMNNDTLIYQIYHHRIMIVC